MSNIVHKSPLELSLQERMYLALRPLTQTVSFSVITSAVVIVIVIFMLGDVAEYYNGNLDAESTLESVSSFSILLIIVAIAYIIWYIIRMRPLQKELDKLRNEFTEQSYFLTLGMSSHGEDVVMDFLQVLFEVFPELKKTAIKSFEKTGYTVDLHEIVLTDRNEGENYVFDTCEDTKYGKFLVKNFSEESVNFEKIEKCAKMAKDNFKKRGNANVMRLVCLAKKFDKDVIEKYEKLMKNKEIAPIDLILVTENGFLPLKISKKLDDRN